MALRQRVEKKGIIVQAMPSMGMSGHAKRQSGAFYIHRESTHNDKRQGLTSSKYPTSKVSIPAHAIHSMNCQSGNLGISRNRHPAQHVALNTPSRMMHSSVIDIMVPSRHGLWRLRPHVSLDFDAHQQKVVPKKNQVAASRRNLLPYLPETGDDIFAIADVIEVPPDLFLLEDLKGVLSVEAWKGCLSPSERKFLRSLLPEGLDHGSLVRSILGGDNFHFGNPLADWEKLLLKGELHPDWVQQRESDARQAYMDHYQEAQSYHENMLKTLRVLKEEWILCKSSGKRLNGNTRRRKIENDGLEASSGGAATQRRKRKRQKVGNSQGLTATATLLPPAECLPKLDNGANSDGGTPYVHTIKVSRKQYAEIMHLFEGKDDELSVAALSPILNCQQRVEVDLTTAHEQREALKVRTVWSSLAGKDIPSAHANFHQHRARKERLAKSAAEQCSQFYSVFVSKDERDGSNSLVPCKLPESVVDLEQSIGAEIEEFRNSSASESSVTSLEGRKEDNQGAVDSCGSSAHTGTPLEDEQICLINLPGAASPVGEGHAALLSSVQAQRSLESNDAVQDEKSSSLHTDSNLLPESDKTSGCHKVSVMNSFCSSKNLDMQDFCSHDTGLPVVDENDSLQSTEKDLINWELHSKPGSEVVSAAAASAESEEVEQRQGLQANTCNGLDQESFLFSGPSTLLISHTDPAENNPFNTQDKQDLAVDSEEKYAEENPCGRLPASAAETASFSQLDHVHSNDYTRVFGMEASQPVSEQNNNQMMLHTFLDQRSHAGVFLNTDLSHCHGLGDHMLMKEQEPITELSLLIDNRSADQRSLCEPAESISSRRVREFSENESVEPHWMMRHTKQVYPFHQHSREIYHLSQDGYSFAPTIPAWSNPQQIPFGSMSHGSNSFTNHWNGGGQIADQSNWTTTEAVTLPFFSSMNDDGGRVSSALPYWEHMSQAPGITPGISSVPSKHEHGLHFFRGTSHVLQGHDNWDHLVQTQSSSQPSYVWPNDKNGMPASQAWKNASMLPQYEQQQLRSAALSKNFKASWQ